MMFFDCIRTSAKPCGLPSKAADSVWHAWVALDPAHLDRFCLRHFGRTIAHTEGPDMLVSMDEALANTLVTARQLDVLPRARANVPRLFSLDRRLRMPRGYAYSVVRGRVSWRRTNWEGAGEGLPTFPASLTAAQLLAAGLVTHEEYRDYKLREHNKEASFEFGTGWGSGSDGGCDGGGSSDGGGSCGGGCGGGCG